MKTARRKDLIKFIQYIPGSENELREALPECTISIKDDGTLVIDLEKSKDKLRCKYTQIHVEPEDYILIHNNGEGEIDVIGKDEFDELYIEVLQ